jgi:class 3 adenylate cyclase/tetratricopeptide (TPR) repeat protein
MQSMQSAGAPTEGHRRHLTVLFTDLRASTPLAGRLEVEVFAELLSGVRRAWHEIAARHGGVVVRTQGDGALIVFGLPRAGEDDGRRAADAALEMHDAVRALGDRPPFSLGPDALALSSGIHAGVVLVGEGDIERGRFDLSGSVPHVAAHLQRNAPAHAVVASVDALGPHAARFELGAEAAVTPDGVRAVQVQGRRPDGRRSDAAAGRPLTPLLGRGDVLAALLRFVASSSVDERCLVVQAAPGLGKSRLLDEFASRHLPPGMQVLLGQCERPASAEPLQPFRRMIRSGGGALPGDVDGAFEAMGALCARQPTVILIDDWQWADNASQRLLLRLMQAPAGPRVLVAARPRDDGSPWIGGVPHLVLPPFDAEQTRLAVGRWLPDADPFLAGRIHDHAGGVPLFVEELCHCAAADGLWREQDGRPGSTGWVGALVASRLAHLPPPQAAVVRAAAVIGPVVPVALLREACEHGVDEATLRALADADFLYRDDASATLRFKHGITQDAIYRSIGLYERTALHRRIEQALRARLGEAEDAPEASEALAFHARGAGRWDDASAHAERAGDRALAAFSLDSARRHYRDALDSLDRVPQRGADHDARWCGLAARLGFTCVFDPLSLPDGLAVFERAVLIARRLGDEVRVAHALYWLAYMTYAVGRFNDAAERVGLALEAARRCGDPRLAAQIEAILGQALAGACEYPSALAAMDAALERKTRSSRPGGGFAIGSAYTLACKGYVHADQGDFDAAHAAFDRALELLGDSTHPVSNSTRNWVALAHLWQGRWHEARQVSSDSERIGIGTRALLLLAVSRAMLGYGRWCAGDDTGLEQLEESVRWMGARRCEFYTSLFHGWLAEAMVHTGRDDRARTAAAAALRRVRDGERLGEASACRAMAVLSARAGRAALARGWLRRAQRSATHRGSRREAALNEVAASLVARQSGDDDLAATIAARAAERLSALGIAALAPVYEGAMPSTAS